MGIWPGKTALFQQGLPKFLGWRLTLVVGGDSPSAVMDFSSIFSSLVSSTAGFSTTSCFFSGLAVLAGQQEKKIKGCLLE